MRNEKKVVTILDLFNPDEIKEKSDGNFQTTCPSCGSDSSGYGGMVLFTKTNTSYCHNSRKWFNLKETFALKKGILRCADGRETND